MTEAVFSQSAEAKDRTLKKNQHVRLSIFFALQTVFAVTIENKIHPVRCFSCNKKKDFANPDCLFKPTCLLET